MASVVECSEVMASEAKMQFTVKKKSRACGAAWALGAASSSVVTDAPNLRERRIRLL
jgi:hypothetical protein